MSGFVFLHFLLPMPVNTPPPTIIGIASPMQTTPETIPVIWEFISASVIGPAGLLTSVDTSMIPVTRDAAPTQSSTIPPAFMAQKLVGLPPASSREGMSTVISCPDAAAISMVDRKNEAIIFFMVQAPFNT